MVFEFKIDGDVCASVFQWGPPEDMGDCGVDIFGNTITTAQARRLSAWLIEAADYAVKENRRTRRLRAHAASSRTDVETTKGE